MINKTMISLAVALSLTLSGCSDDETLDPETLMTVVELAEEAGFSTLVTALQATGLDQTLSEAGPFTVFAPSNAAFDALPAGTLTALLNDPDALAEILTYHVVAGRVTSGDLAGVVSAVTVNGAPILFDFSSGVAVNGANVTQADIEGSNGIIHVIDQVLPPTDDIVATALGNADFSTLVAALTAADLVDDLQAAGPFTVFAPTDAAFAALPAGTLTALLNDVPALTDILLYHVASGQFFAGDLDGSPVGTLQGSNVDVDLSAGVTINGATVVIADLLTTNGVIHVIDAVLLPPAAN